MMAILLFEDNYQILLFPHPWVSGEFNWNFCEYIIWMLKKTLSLRQFFWVPTSTTYILGGNKKVNSWTEPEGGQRVRTPHKITKIKGFLAILVRIPWKIKKATKPEFMQCSNIIDMPAKRHLNGVSLAGRWWPAFSGILSSLFSSTKEKKKEKTVNLDPLWQKFLDPYM